MNDHKALELVAKQGAEALVLAIQAPVKMLQLTDK